MKKIVYTEKQSSKTLYNRIARKFNLIFKILFAKRAAVLVFDANDKSTLKLMNVDICLVADKVESFHAKFHQNEVKKHGLKFKPMSPNDLPNEVKQNLARIGKEMAQMFTEEGNIKDIALEDMTTAQLQYALQVAIKEEKYERASAIKNLLNQKQK